MEKKYEQFYDIKLKDIEGFFGGSQTLKLLATNNVSSLGELFEFSDKTEFVDKFIDSTLGIGAKVGAYREIYGSTKLLRYKYLGEDINFDTNSNIADLGFTSLALGAMGHFKLNEGIPICLRNYMEITKGPWRAYELSSFSNIDFFEYIEKFTSKATLDEISRIRGVGKNVIKELEVKSSILVQYSKERMKKTEKSSEDDSSQDLKELLQELEILMEKNKILTGQIAVVQEKIKLCMEVQNGTSRQK